MTTSTPVLLEFRCNRCWNSNFADVEDSGTECNCRHCGQTQTIPEATEARIARAMELLAQSTEALTSPAATPVYDERIPTDAELREIARRESYLPIRQMDFSGYPRASTVQRFLAYVIDVTMTVFVVIGGFFFTYWLSTLGSGPNLMEEINLHGEMSLSSLITFGTLPALFTITQYFLLATTGQTLGKKIMCIRVVSSVSGRAGGFIQAVLLRDWLFRLLGFIPFFTLIDHLFGLSDSGRCIHDYVSGTRVVESV